MSRKFRFFCLTFLILSNRLSLFHRTENEVREYIKTEWLPTISDQDLESLLEAYPADISQGSPYDTGILNALSPQFKRFASFQGDAVFQAPRRFFFENLDGKQPIWAFRKLFQALNILFTTNDWPRLSPVSKREKAVPFLGSVSINFINRFELD
jgi:hypothetical protein